METISNYLDTMFMNLPSNEEIKQLKNDILSNMEEKYMELKEKGLSENEAIGLVISEFGNIDELLLELDMTKDRTMPLDLDYPTLGIEEVDEFIAMKKSVGVGIGFGVILCGVAAACILVGLGLNTLIIGIIAGIILGAGAVGMFIVNGLNHSKYEYLEKGFFLEDRTKAYLEIEKENYEKSFNLSIVLGVSLLIISAIPILVGLQIPQWDLLLFVSMTVVIGVVGVFFLVYGGNVKAGYDYLLQEGMDAGISEEELRKTLFWKKFNERFWLIVVAGYLLTSFLFNNWGISWIVFPVAGVLSGIWSNNHSK